MIFGISFRLDSYFITSPILNPKVMSEPAGLEDPWPMRLGVLGSRGPRPRASGTLGLGDPRPQRSSASRTGPRPSGTGHGPSAHEKVLLLQHNKYKRKHMSFSYYGKPKRACLLPRLLRCVTSCTENAKNGWESHNLTLRQNISYWI